MWTAFYVGHCLFITMRAYGNDLRWRVVFLRYIREMTMADISHTLIVSKSFVSKVLKRYHESGDVKRRPPGHKPRLMSCKLAAMLFVLLIWFGYL